MEILRDIYRGAGYFGVVFLAVPVIGLILFIISAIINAGDHFKNKKQ